MKSKSLFVLLLFFINNLLAGPNYFKAYYLNSSGSKIEGYILDEDNKYNPTWFYFKKSLESPEVKLKNKDVKEVVFENGKRYISAITNIEISDYHIQYLDSISEPIFKRDTIFLLEIISANKSLYKYRNNNRVHFYINNAPGEITPLIYKKFVRNKKIYENENYKMQLLNFLNCENGSLNNSINQLEYTEESIGNIFKKYYACNKEEYSSVSLRKEKNISYIKLSLNSTAIMVDDHMYSIDESIPGNYNLSLGFEYEHIFPYYHNRFSLLLNLMYNSVKGNGHLSYYHPLTPSSQDVEFKYNSLNFGFGIKYTITKLNNKELYIIPSLNVAYVLNEGFIDFKKDFKYRIDGFLPGYSISLGYQIFTNFSTELQYSKSTILPLYNAIDAINRSISINMKYSISK